MQVKTIPSEAHIALMAILNQYVPGITPPVLVAALKAYEPQSADGEKLDSLMTVSEVQKLLGVSGATVANLIKAGKLRRVARGGLHSVRISKASVQEFLKS